MNTGSRRHATIAADTVLAWRHRRLLAAGFPDALASALAADPRADLHAHIELTERGCPPELAARILAPLGDEPR